MVKFTSAALFLAIAAISSAAPIISPSVTPSATATASATVSATASADIPSATDVSADPTVISIAAKDDVFSSDVKYTGRATWFTHTYGACNENWDGESEPIVALNAHQMGAESWGNPACNKKVKVTNKNNGKVVVARIVDKCPGNECAFGSLDLSPAAFKQLGELATGVLNIEWNYL
ncbi:hypothetical protein KVV02_000449 [Mortierella alpina]|uniref:RlpA-like protein double-psi beta-barrel domain-containing protein n=2 Tax=Mortierella alpina TaxID=64518 RepID=A0A9P8IHR7_MORAP|nr:hypothetical protein KVV02_000449 [Mortierella alpina]